MSCPLWVDKKYLNNHCASINSSNYVVNYFVYTNTSNITFENKFSL